MVFFVLPIVTFFTGLIGGATLHFVRGNHDQNQDHQNETNHENNNGQRNLSQKEQLIEQKERKKHKLGSKKYGQEKREETRLRKSSKNQQLSNSSSCVSSGSQRRRFTCPLTKKLICDPAELLCGHYFEKKNILQYLQKYKKCPICQKKSRKSEIYYSGDFKNMIEKYKARKEIRRQFRNRMIDDFGSLNLQWKKVIQEKKKSFSKNNRKKGIQIHSEGQELVGSHYYFNDY